MAKFVSTAVSVISSVQSKMGTFAWRVSLLAAALIFIGCQGQTFQYSRGWTNGKRGGAGSFAAVPSSSLTSNNNGPTQNQVFDVDAAIVNEGSLEDPASPSGAFHMMNPDGPSVQGARFRLARDYSQQLSRKLVSGVNSGKNQKAPFWILGVDQEQNTADF